VAVTRNDDRHRFEATVQAFMKRHPEYADLVTPPAPPGGSK
jgi:hypothetical protein